MSVPVLIMGEPGSGKSSSMRNFERDELHVIQTIRKPLPFKNNLKTAASRNFDTVTKWVMNDKDCRALVVDDFGYLITDLYMRYSYGAEKIRDQYEVYKCIANKVYMFITGIMDDGNDDRVVYIMMHLERDNMGNVEPATIGKLLNEKVKLIGMFTIALMSLSNGESYEFMTNGQPFKSPPGMLPLQMDNDLKAADTALREYWGMKPIKDEQETKGTEQ